MTTAQAQPRITDKALARMLPAVPKSLVRRFADPYIAGESEVEAIRQVKLLRSAQMATTVDVLGEAITLPDEALQTRDQYLSLIDSLGRLNDPAAVNVSIKLTALGLDFDQAMAFSYLKDIVERCAQHNGFVRIDMEDSPYTDRTLAMYYDLRAAGLDNVGVVIQAYLLRSAADIDRLISEQARVRVVKGIYIEPASIAYRAMSEINSNYVALCARLLDGGCHVAFATHDEHLVKETTRLVRERDLPKDRYEFQMLLGVREELRDSLVATGEPMRVYIPYGQRWYEYSVRRLRENPRIAGYVTADVFRSVGRKLTFRKNRAK